MKVLLINGSKDKNGILSTGMEILLENFRNREIETEEVWLGESDIAPCLACGKCIKKRKCIIEDRVNELAERMKEFDGIIFGGDVFYGKTDAQLTEFMTRLFRSANDRMACKPASYLLYARRGRSEEAAAEVSEFFHLAGMPILVTQERNTIASADDRAAADEIAEQMTWMLKCLEAGKKAGIARPATEIKKRMDFMR